MLLSYLLRTSLQSPFAAQQQQVAITNASLFTLFCDLVQTWTGPRL
jgi:hypothetical protein